jgi:DNA invertase Pin-like site-specific DNA recombinase
MQLRVNLPEGLGSVAAYETEVRKERQLAGIAKAKAEGKTWGGRRPGTRIKLTVEKEMLIQQLHAEGKPVAAIARMVGLTRKTVYKAIGQSTAARRASLIPGKWSVACAGRCQIELTGRLCRGRSGNWG